MTILPAPTSVTAFLGRVPRGPLDAPTPIRSFAEFNTVFGGLSVECPLTYAVHHYFLNGGADAVVVGVRGSSPGGEVTDGELADPERTALGEGLWALKDGPGFNLLCIPPLSRTRDVSAGTLATALAFCRDRRAMLLVDPPSTWASAAQVADPGSGLNATGLAGPDALNGALYFPRMRAPDPLQGNTVESFAASGAIAGVIARTDAGEGVWSAPAGAKAELRGFSFPEVSLTGEECRRLVGLGVNPVRTFGDAPLLWGARTLAGRDTAPSDWRYLPVRRLALHVERSVAASLTPAATEPLGAQLWAQVRTGAEAFLHTLYQQGALSGRFPQEAYFVKCGRDTMTQADIDAGRLIVQLGIAPLRPAEFILLTLGQWRSDEDP